MMHRLDIEDLVEAFGEAATDTCCDVKQCQDDVAAYIFHPDYPNHPYTLCSLHASEEVVNHLVAEWRKESNGPIQS